MSREFSPLLPAGRPEPQKSAGGRALSSPPKAWRPGRTIGKTPCGAWSPDQAISPGRPELQKTDHSTRRGPPPTLFLPAEYSVGPDPLTKPFPPGRPELQKSAGGRALFRLPKAWRARKNGRGQSPSPTGHPRYKMRERTVPFTDFVLKIRRVSDIVNQLLKEERTEVETCI